MTSQQLILEAMSRLELEQSVVFWGQEYLHHSFFLALSVPMTPCCYDSCGVSRAESETRSSFG